MTSTVERPQHLAIGVIVPCRNESAVIERKLANLARAQWPQTARRHVVVVVDDGSEDGTFDRASSIAARVAPAPSPFEVRVVKNALRAGKPGAIQQGLAELAGRVDLLAISDADVIVEPHAIEAMVRAFERDGDLAMACLSQRFVATLSPDGACGGTLIDAASAFDRWTAKVRRVESRFGALFSVHGQFLAWRASLELAPRPGFAADDIELALQVRARAEPPRAIRMLSEAAFLEVKTRAPGPAREQELRRARAYVQVMRASRVRVRSAFGLAQICFYRRVPLAAPALTVALPVLAIGGACAWRGPLAGGIAIAAAVLALATPPVRRWIALMRVIHAARKLESGATLSERWEMARS